MSRWMSFLVGGLVAAAGLASPSRARAEADAAGSTPSSHSRSDGRYEFWQAEGALRVARVRDGGYEPFSTSDSFTAAALALSRTVVRSGAVTFAPGFTWETGSSEASVRGVGSSLGVDRLLVTAEARFHLLSMVYAFARLAPGAQHTTASLDHPSGPSDELRDGFWTFAFDQSVGAAYLVTSHDEPYAPQMRLWISAEGGYGYTSRHDVLLRPDLPDDRAARYGGVALGSLSMSGPFVRVAAAVSY